MVAVGGIRLQISISEEHRATAGPWCKPVLPSWTCFCEMSYLTASVDLGIQRVMEAGNSCTSQRRDLVKMREPVWWELCTRKPFCKIQLAKFTHVCICVGNHPPSAWADDDITSRVSMQIRGASSHPKPQQETKHLKGSSTPPVGCPVTLRSHSWAFPTFFKAGKCFGNLTWAPEGQFL